jgi:FkbM family methyltransferase
LGSEVVGGSTADRIALLLASPLRRAVRLLRTPKSSVPTAEKVLRGAVFLPVYVLLLVPLIVRALLGRPIVVPARTRFGATLTCRLPDLIQTYIWIFNEWEPDLTHFIAGRLTDGDVFIDIGANIGYYSLLAAECVGTGGRVVAVEASPTVFGELQRNVLANDFENRIREVNKAAAATAGTLTIYAGPLHNVGMSTTVQTHGMRAESTVEALPLDQLLTSDEIASTRLIKIDVEGGEPDVVAGMTNLIKALRADAEIVIELSPKWWPDRQLRPVDVLRPFTEAGFNVYEMRNSYSAWRYLWLNDVSDAVRVRRELTERVSRLDLVLSRRDADRLPIDSTVLKTPQTNRTK